MTIQNQLMRGLSYAALESVFSVEWLRLSSKDCEKNVMTDTMDIKTLAQAFTPGMLEELHADMLEAI